MMKWKVMTGMLVLFLMMTSMLVFAQDDKHMVRTSTELKAMVEQFKAAGDFQNEATARSLITHLTSVEHFENRDETDKVIRHMEGFIQLLDHHYNNEWISGQAYHMLKPQSEYLIQWTNSLKLVLDGQAQSVVVIADDANQEIVRLADLFVDYVQKSTGAVLPVTTAGAVEVEASEEMIRIYIGDSGLTEDIAEELATLHMDGYSIQTQEGSVSIVGPTDRGTEHGVYEFLERYAGVRWLMPGPDGEDVPQMENLLAEYAWVLDEPVYKSRQMWGLHAADYRSMTDNRMNYEWGVRNRLHSTIEGYFHNMNYLFFPGKGRPAEHYPTLYPEVYPMRNGERYIPTSDVRWQPCFSEPIAAELAAGTVIDYFHENPEQSSFSLAVNDGLGYCEAEPDHPLNPHRLNSMGYPDMSDIYFNWVNQVVERVLEVHPDKWFGVLAYLEVNDPPSFDLHPRVVPYFTKDRMAWIDEDIRNKDIATIHAWNEVSDNLAFYDYVYGTPYMVPRVYPHVMAEYLRYGADHGVIAFFGELSQNWGEGPKPWLLTKLLWDPEQDVDELLNEWYVRTVGADAAPDLKAYYDHWEHFWTERIKEHDWFETRKDITYLSYYWGTYLEAITDEEMAYSRQLLESVMAKTDTPAQAARAELLYTQFEYYEASVLSYPKAVAEPADEEEALALLEEGAQMQLKADYAQKRADLIAQFSENPLLEHPANPFSNGLEWSGLNPAYALEIVNYIKQHEPMSGPVRHRLAEMTVDESPSVQSFAKLVQHMLEGTVINANPSFEIGTDQAQGWDTRVVNFGEFKRVEEPGNAHSGNASIYVHDFYYGDIRQTVPVKPGMMLAKVNYFVTPDTVTVGDTWVQLDLLDENGLVLETFKSSQQAYATHKGQWNTVAVMGIVPETVDGKAVKSVRVSNTVNGFFEGGTLYMDDFEVFQSAESDPLPPMLLSHAEAENGRIIVHLHEEPEAALSLEDFSITKRINQEDAGIVFPTELEWVEEDKKVILAVPKGTAEIWSQAVAYEIGYLDSALVSSMPFTIEADTTGLNQVVQNSSFEQWSTERAAEHWIFWGDGFTRSDALARSGEYSVAADGLQPGQNEAGGGGPIHDLDLDLGKYVGVFHFNTAVQTNGTLHWLIQLKDQSGQVVRRIQSDIKPAALSNGSWLPVTTEFEVLPGETSARFFVLMKDFQRGDTIYFDDVELYLLPEELPAISHVEADQGTLTISFQGLPETGPAAADLTLEQSLNASHWQSVNPVDMMWDEATKTASIILPEVPEQLWDQSLIYRVRYQEEAFVNSNRVNIPSAPRDQDQFALNASFEQWSTARVAEHWTFWGDGFSRSDVVVRTGNYSVVADGLQPGQNEAGGGGPIQALDLDEGSYAGLFRFNTAAATNGTLQWSIHIRDEHDQVVRRVTSELRQAVSSNGEWVPIESEFEIRPGEASIRYFLLIKDFQRGDTIYFDDVEIFKVNGM